MLRIKKSELFAHLSSYSQYDIALKKQFLNFADINLLLWVFQGLICQLLVCKVFG